MRPLASFAAVTFLSVITMASLPAKPLRVAFVLDDGPVAATTPGFLELFKKEGIHVNFSYVGSNVAKEPALAAAAVKAGHEINNHSFTHPHLKTLPEAEVKTEISRANEEILKATGAKAAWFWAPFLESDDMVDAQVKANGLHAFPYWEMKLISSDDWNVTVTDADQLQKNATTGVVDGTVILFHEWRAETLQRMPAIIAELRKQGAVFMTFSELKASLDADKVAK